MKIACQIEYLGKNYHGWQRQSHCASVQSLIEKSLSYVADEKIEVTCAGRTDQGVHATAQIIHFETSKDRPISAWIKGSNALLPKDIKILWAKEVNNSFHARFSAKWRTYRYVIYHRNCSSAILSDLVTWVKEPLDIKKMETAAKDLLGEKDFSSFRAAECQSNSVHRNIMEVKFTQLNSFIIFEIRGNAFLHHMVRNIVGSLLEIGLGNQAVTWIKTLLDLKDRTKAGKTAPACGLYFVDVGYDEEFLLPKLALGPDFLHA
ncbi:tRNA pseudouridine(38-40) synthase TruA [Thiotrichales bacterium 19S9-12]|nr:tRNA pseudouridine(38-40) synthase TruA [Thiotrichales bacterium 19S9-11]MCF6811168.1 tRNA pseudouridine(38-40) synthase TruA [Thiotrichales bacterium 19S9-12]